jgi:hypothetical protein
VITIFAAEGVALVEINCQMVAVCRIYIYSEKYSAVSKATQILTMTRTHMPMHIHCVMHMPLPERTDFVMGTLHIMAMANDYREMCACWMPKNITHHLKTFHMGLSFSFIRHIIDERE